jgi:hypothetical protein
VASAGGAAQRCLICKELVAVHALESHTHTCLLELVSFTAAQACEATASATSTSLLA